MTSGGGAGGQAAVVHVDVVGRFEEFERRINELESQAGNAGESAGSAFSGKFSAGLAIATAGAVALAGAVVGVAASSFNLAQEAAQNVDEFQSKLGATREEAEMLGGVAEQVFGNNWTGSLEEAGQAVANVRKEISDLADEDLQKVTEGTVAIAETFEQEQGTVAAAVQSLMKATGMSAQEAMDFITAGFQKGLDSSGDFLDTLNEYGPQFEKSKIGADQLFSLLETGAAKGALGTDKIADAFKEFGLTVVEVSDASADVYNEIGLSHAKIVADINSGKTTTAEAFQLVVDKVKQVKGEADRTRIMAAIFGGAGEDLAAGIKGLDLTKTKLSELGGATDSLNQRYTSLNDFAAGMWRKIQVAMLPVGKELLGMANEAVPYLQKAFDGVAQKLPGMIRTGIDAAKQFGTTAVNVYNSVRPAIDATITTVEKLSGFISRNREVLIPLTAAVGAGAAAFGLYRAGVVAVTAAKAAWTVATTTATTASIALRAAITFLTGPIGLVITAVGLLVGAGVALYRNWDEIKAFADRTWGAIKEIVANAINGAVAFLRGVDMRGLGLDIVQGLVNGILAGPRLVLAAARGLGSAVINGVKGVLNIQSPSRVMQELGEFTAQGFVKGIESQVPSVRKAAQETSKAFLEALGDLKLERETGGLNLTTYTRTLEQAAVQLRAKLKTVQEGTPAYSDWLKALKAVTTELDGVKGKATETQTAAKQMADEMARNRAQIVQGEAMERYVQGLRSATAAQLQHALETARARGETERYNAIRDEMKRRTEAATTAQEKATEAARNHQQQLADNRAQIAATEAQERYIKGLRAATDAQLASALQTARTRGEVERYNAIRDEQKRRAEAVASAEDKAAEATRRAAEAVEQGRKAIADAREYDTWKAAMQRATDDQLASGLAAYEAAGNQQRYNDVLAEQKRRADEAAAAVSVLVDEQIKAANAQYANVQAAADMAYRQSYGVGEGGLVSALSALTGFTPEQVRADVERALTELERLNPGAAAIVGRAYADVLAEQRQAVQEQQSLWNLQAEGNKRAADTAIAEADRLSEDGDWSGAARVLEDALDDLYAAAEGGEDAADAINAVTDALNRLAAARAGLKGNDRTLADWRDLVASGQQDPMMDGPVEARGTRPKETPTVVSPPRVAPEVIKSWDDFSKAIAKAEWVRETTDELKAMDATQLANAKTLAISSRDLDRYNLVLAEEERRAKAAAEGSKLLADLTREAARAAGETQRPYADQIAKLTELRGVVGVNQVELEKLILKFQDLQAQAEKQQGIDKMVGKINEFSNYARQAIPIVTGAMQALGGVTGEVADQWASDLGSMVGDLTNIATAIAKGDWIGAAVQGLMSIFNWFNRNAEAASKAAKATADYNNQFKFAQGTAGGNYGTRTTGSYTTGFLFWSTTHYTEQIDQMKKDLALAAENGFVNGMKSGFNEALAKSDFSLFEKSLKTSVGRAVLDGLLDSFINQAIIAKIIGPAIDAYLKTGDTAALRTAIQAASGEARKFYDDVLAPIAQEFGLLGTDAAKPAPDAPTKPESDIKTIKVEMPTVSASLNFDVLSTLATVVERAAPRIETGGLAMVDGANRLLIAADRFERVVTGLELTPQGFRS